MRSPRVPQEKPAPDTARTEMLFALINTVMQWADEVGYKRIEDWGVYGTLMQRMDAILSGTKPRS